MKIEILGNGCASCKALEENAKKAVAKAGVKAQILKVTQMEKIIAYGIMSTPAIVIAGKVKASGRVPDAEEIIKWL